MATKPTTTNNRKTKVHKSLRRSNPQIPETELPLVVPAMEMEVPMAEESISLNHRLAKAQIPVWARNHGIDVANPKEAGMRPMIARALIVANAVYPLGNEELAPAPGQDATSPEFAILTAVHRAGMLKVCLEAEAIYDFVKSLFGEGVRYGFQSVKTVISAMVRDRLLGVIRPTSAEEPCRSSNATHCRYYLVSNPPPVRIAKRGFQAAPIPIPTPKP